MAETAGISISQVNEMGQNRFVSTLAEIFEHSPWVAEGAWASRPFATRQHLLEAMTAVVTGAGRELQLGLIRSHPDLAGKAAVVGELTAYSSNEQAGAGLDQCSAEEFERLQELNAQYKARFGFPFILAVKGLDRDAIIRAFESRLHHDEEQEFQLNLNQICTIAGFRLTGLIRD